MQLRKSLESRLDPAWSFNTLYITQDSFGMMLEAAGMWEDSFKEYVELEACYTETQQRGAVVEADRGGCASLCSLHGSWVQLCCTWGLGAKLLVSYLDLMPRKMPCKLDSLQISPGSISNEYFASLAAGVLQDSESQACLINASWKKTRAAVLKMPPYIPDFKLRQYLFSVQVGQIAAPLFLRCARNIFHVDGSPEI